MRVDWTLAQQTVRTRDRMTRTAGRELQLRDESVEIEHDAAVHGAGFELPEH